MKKFAALLLAVLTMLFACTAMAEDLTAMVEGAFDGVWVQFEEGFEIYLPSNWLEYEVNEELLNAGIAYVAASEDGANTFQLAWQPLEEEVGVNELCEYLAAEMYPDAEVLEINGIEMIFCTDTENDLSAIVAMDGAELGMYMFMFTPASDADFIDNVATYIALSIRNIE